MKDVDLSKEFYNQWLERVSYSIASDMNEKALIDFVLKQGKANNVLEAKLIAKELKKIKRKFPLQVDFKNLKDEDNIIAIKRGASIEEVKSLCKIIGGHSFTSDNLIKRQLQQLGDNSFWTKFGILYSGLPFKYLNKVDIRYILKLRKEDRISGVRQVLRDLSNFLSTTDLSEVRNDQILSFSDQFKDAVNSSEAEWERIIVEAKTKNIAAIFGSGLIQVAIDPTKILIPGIGIPSSIAINEFLKRKRIKHLIKTDPFTVFAELKYDKPNFFSEIKRSFI